MAHGLRQAPAKMRGKPPVPAEGIGVRAVSAAPGKIVFAGIEDLAELANLLAYLRTMSGNPVVLPQ